MAVTLGYEPDDLTVILSPGRTFYASGTSDTALDPGTVLALIFDDGTEWDATITAGTGIQFTVAPAAVDAVLASDVHTVALVCTDGPIVLDWAVGTVRVANSS